MDRSIAVAKASSSTRGLFFENRTINDSRRLPRASAPPSEGVEGPGYAFLRANDVGAPIVLLDGEPPAEPDGPGGGNSVGAILPQPALPPFIPGQMPNPTPPNHMLRTTTIIWPPE